MQWECPVVAGVSPGVPAGVPCVPRHASACILGRARRRPPLPGAITPCHNRPPSPAACPQRASCGSYPELAAFLASPNPPLSDAFATDDYVQGQAYKETDGYRCVLDSVKAIVESWTPRCQSGTCKTAVQDIAWDRVPPFVDYSAGRREADGHCIGGP